MLKRTQIRLRDLTLRWLARYVGNRRRNVRSLSLSLLRARVGSKSGKRARKRRREPIVYLDRGASRDKGRRLGAGSRTVAEHTERALSCGFEAVGLSESL